MHGISDPVARRFFDQTIDRRLLSVYDKESF